MHFDGYIEVEVFIMIQCFIFIFCICIGSFLNVLIYRLPIGEDFVIKRSYCPNCKHELEFYDLLPIFSYLILKGKCRYCDSKISILYPFIEILCGCIGLWCYEMYGFNVRMCLHFMVFAILIVISFIDIKTMLILDEFNIGIIILALIRIFMFKLDLFEHIFYAFLIVLLVWIINRIKLSFGGGDLKLFFSLGLYLGEEIFLVLLLSIFFGSIYGIYLLIIKKAERNSFIPFAPFIALACLVCIFYGRYLIRWYIRL